MADAANPSNPRDLCAKFIRLMSPKAYAQSENLVHPSIEIINIRSNSEVRVESPHQCSTHAVNTCIGVAIINKQKKIAYLLHQFPGDDEYIAFVKKALDEANKPSDLLVAVVGNVQTESRDVKDNYWPPKVQSVVGFLDSSGIPRRNIGTAVGNRGSVSGHYSIRVDPKEKQIYIMFVSED